MADRSIRVAGGTVILALGMVVGYGTQVYRYLVVTVDDEGACRVGRMTELADADEFDEIEATFALGGELANRQDAVAYALKDAGYGTLSY